MKKARIILLSFCLFLTLMSPGVVQAQGGPTISSSSVQSEFPANLNFSLSATSSVNITDVRLHYTVDQESFAQVTGEAYVVFTPARTINVSWSWDMRRTGGLPPGTGLTYWWTVTDASGSRIESAPAKIQFDDKRYSWQSSTQGMVTIYWYQGGKSFGDEIAAATQDGLSRLADFAGAKLTKPVKLYIYASTQDLQGALIFPQEWTGGVTYTSYRTIAIGIAPNNLIWGKRAITHELTHLVIGEMTFNPYNGLPPWLDEGLAMYNEGLLEVNFSSALVQAVKGNSLISVRSLASPFSAYPDKATLSYAESYSLVEFLVTKYGQDKMFNLLNTFREGSTYDNALLKVYGFDMDGLDRLWRVYVAGQFQSAAVRAGAAFPGLAVTLTGPATKSRVLGWCW